MNPSLNGSSHAVRITHHLFYNYRNGTWAFRDGKYTFEHKHQGTFKVGTEVPINLRPDRGDALKCALP